MYSPYAFICFKDPNDAQNCLKAIDQKPLLENQKYLAIAAWAMKKQERANKLKKEYLNQKYDSHNFLYINNLRNDITEEEISKVFAQCGEFESIKIKKDPHINRMTNFATIKFRTQQDATNVYEQLKGSALVKPPAELNEEYLNLFRDKTPYINFLMPGVQFSRFKQATQQNKSGNFSPQQQ